MTEDEAKTKKCCGPKVLISAIFVAAGKHQSDPMGPLNCIGSACMAWRWDDYEQTDGYCGLAGRPPSGPQLAGKP